MDAKEQKELNKGIRSAWRKVGKANGLPLLSPALSIYRDVKEKDFGDDEVQEGSVDDFEAYVEAVVQRERSIIERLLRLDSQCQYVKSKSTNAKPNRTRRHQKNFNRQLRIVVFVLDWHANLNDIVNRQFKKRITKWDTLAGEWNEAFPYDQMSADTLSRNFRNAVREEDVQQAYFEKKEAQIREAFWPAFEAISEQIEDSITPTEQALLDSPVESIDSPLSLGLQKIYDKMDSMYEPIKPLMGAVALINRRNMEKATEKIEDSK